MSQIRLICLAIFVSATAFAQQGWEEISAVPIDRFHEVAPGIYRGARPTKQGLDALAAAGFKTIINLDDDKKPAAEEARYAKSLGIETLSEPMSGFWSPKDPQVDRILEHLADPSHRPLFIHCQHGRDRTGLLVGLFRFYLENVPAEKAYYEMLDMGFRRSLVFLDAYYRERTEMD